MLLYGQHLWGVFLLESNPDIKIFKHFSLGFSNVDNVEKLNLKKALKYLTKEKFTTILY